MNIFVLSRSPRLSAQYHCNKHVVKMIIETAQMLYSAVWIVSPQRLPQNAYKLAHKNHPCSIWVRTSLENYKWLCELGVWLCHEYTLRYGKIHKTQTHIEYLMQHPPNLPSLGLTEFAQAMPDQFKDKDPVVAYRTFYRESKFKERNIVQYKWRKMPEWLTRD